VELSLGIPFRCFVGLPGKLVPPEIVGLFQHIGIVGFPDDESLLKKEFEHPVSGGFGDILLLCVYRDLF